LASIFPIGASRLQTLDVTFTGTNFVAGYTSVNFGASDITVNSVKVNSGTSLVANITVAGNATMSARDVSVTNPAPGGGTSAKKTFTVGDNPAPSIASLTPAAGNRLMTLDVVVQGTNFIPGVTSVDFGSGITVNKTTINTSAQLTANITIPVTAATGTRTVTVVNAPPGGGTATRTSGFSVNNPAPTLTRVSPANGKQLQTLNIVFYGSGFINSVTSVNMGFGVNIKSLTVVSDSQMTASITITTDAEPGVRDVQVTNLGPVGGTAVLSPGFVIGNNPKPTITSLSLSSVKRLEIFNMTVRGTNFIAAVTSIDLGAGIIINTTTVDSAKQITVNATVLPTAPTGPRTVFVINADPGGGRDSILSGLSVVNPVPTLTSVTPSVVTRGKTIEVVCRGTNFISGTTSASLGADVNINSTTVDSVTKVTVNVTIASTATLGTRNVTVTNATPGGGTTAPLTFQITVAAPATPMLQSPTDGQLYLPLTLLLRWDSSAGAGWYHVQVARNSQFIAGTLDVDDSTLTTTSRLIGSPTQLINGTLYYWRVRAGNAGGASAWTSPAWSFKPFYPGTFELVHNYVFPAYNAPGDYKATDYRLIGLPGTSTALISTLLGGTQTTDWQLYYDNGSATEPFFTAFDGTSTFVSTVGRAYWLIHKGEWKLSASVLSEPLDATGAVLLPVHRGWNLITNPFTTSVLWTDVQKVNGTAASGSIWTYQGGFSASTVLDSYLGYYFYSDSGRTLRLPYGATTRVLKSDVVQPDITWKVDIELRGDGFVDRSTTIGVAGSASEGLDRFDQRKPRALGETTTITIPRRDLDPEFSSFASDFRPPFEELAKWPFEIRTKERKPMSLVFDKPGDIPEEYVAYLVDQVRATKMNLREKTEYTFKPVTDVSSFAVIAGKVSAVEQELNKLLPREFSLDNNFPNPFNPTTTIPVAVPFTSNVSLKVYNVLGEEVKVLQDGVLDAGRYWLTWDGRNNNGNAVASGMYIIRMATGSGAKFTGKMLLLK
jgi:hypothetical protein